MQERYLHDPPANRTHRKLMAFDFDHTVVDDNTDIVVRDLVKSKISDEITKLYKKSGWIPYMQEIFYLLHGDGFGSAQILDAIQQIPEVASMKTLFRELNDTGTVDIIIISDSNSVFIKHWCDYNNVSDYIKRVFTNQAHFNDEDVLKIQPYHEQSECRLSSENLCKGKVLEDYVQSQLEENNVVYDSISYIGDGNNDICPILRLASHDFGYARKDYRMHKELDKNNTSLDATLEIWTDGRDLKQLIFEHL